MSFCPAGLDRLAEAAIKKDAVSSYDSKRRLAPSLSELA